MWWRKSKPAQFPPPDSDASLPLSPATQQVLTAAGWRAGRRTDVTPLAPALKQAGFAFHPRARAFLTEFYGLQVVVPVAGWPDVAGFVHLDPLWALRFLGRDAAADLKRLVRGAVCPVGTASGHSMFVLMGEGGAVHLLDREWSVFATLAGDPVAALEAFCDGRNGRVDAGLLIDGRPTGVVLREGDERPHWGMEQFPDVAEFFPPASLEPARRPPTAHAMPRTIQKLISDDKVPREKWASLLITNGGFTSDGAGQTYYAAHTENVLAIRRAAPFKVSGPPPGLGPGAVRTGECIPYAPPK